MKKYKEFITEKRDTLMALSPYGFHYGDEDALRITGLVNPSRGELEGFINRTKHKSARFLLHDGRLLVWDAADAIHADVLEGEYRLGKGALYKLANNNKKFAHGVFLTTADGLEVRVIEPSPWVSSLLRKDSKTKHIVGPDVEFIATDDNGMPLKEGFLTEAAKRRKGWLNLKSGKMVLSAMRGGSIRPYHDEYVANNPKKFFRGGEDELLRRFADMNGFEPEDEETISMWVDIKSGKVDRDPNFDSVMEEDGWVRVVFDGEFGISSVETNSKRDAMKAVSLILDKVSWGNIDSLYVYEKGYGSDPHSATRPGSIELYSEEDAIAYAKTGRVAKRTDIGRTMAMFRGESVEISQLDEASYGHTLWIDPRGKVYDMNDRKEITDPKGYPYTHYDWVAANFTKYFGKTAPDNMGKVVYDAPHEQGWARIKNHRRDMDIEVNLRKLNRAQKKVIRDIYDDGGDTTRGLYIDTWEKNKTNRSKDKYFQDYDSIVDFLSESVEISQEGNIKKYSEFLLNEEKITAADWENFITVAFNGGPSKDKNTPIKSIAAYNAAKPALKKIVATLKANKFSGKMVQTGSSVGKLNPAWQGTDTTPKADMVIGKTGLSLKKKGGSQLMSAKKEETLSTFHAAIAMMDENAPNQATKLAGNLSKLMTEFAVPKKIGTIGDFTTRTKSGAKQRGTEKELATQYVEKTNLFKSMTEEIRSFFDNNQDFRNYFVYEAATGAYKFKPDPSAVADFIVAFDADSGETSVHRISRGYGRIGSYIPTLASSVKLRISWKTHSSGSQKTFPSFRADVRDDVNTEETFQSMFEQHFSELDEGIFSNIASKIKSFFTKITRKIMELAKRGISAILRFFNIEPESISMSDVLIESVEISEGTYAKSGLGKWMNQQSAGGGPGWDRYNEKGERVGKCGDAKEGEPYAACLSKQKADKLGKEKIGEFVRRKRAAQKKAGDKSKGGEEKKGQKPVFVKTGVTDLKDDWSQKYKDSIDCNNPKGFSQKAHCQGKKKNEENDMKSFKTYLDEKNVPLDPALWKRAISQAKSKFDVYPSAYANAWAAKWYKGKGGKWRAEEECDCDCDEIIEEVVIEENGEKKNVKLNDPFRTPDGPKKFAVYVKNDKGNVVLVRFGDPNLSIKRDDPDRLKNFRARHGCDEDPGPKWKAKYWSCKFWEKDSPVSKLLSKGKVS